MQLYPNTELNYDIRNENHLLLLWCKSQFLVKFLTSDSWSKELNG